MDEAEIAALRRMTPAQKLAVMNALIRQAYELKAGIRASRPDLTAEEVWARAGALVGGEPPDLIELMMGSLEKARGYPTS